MNTTLHNGIEKFINTITSWLVVAAAIAHLLNPQFALAQTLQQERLELELPDLETTLTETPAMHMFHPDRFNQPDRYLRAVITAYTSTPDQTDDSPFIAASGKRVHDGMIAANGLPFGTVIKIPSLYGNKEFVVEDRMNARYEYGRMDIWFDVSKAEARKFGVKRVEVEIYLPQAKHLAQR